MTKTTNANIETLRAEAAAHGDAEMVAACDRALAGDQEARQECQDAIDAAFAMVDYAHA
jgi:hypothetical protein